jgi:guanine deaminase
MAALSAYRGTLLHFLSEPGEHPDPASFEWIEDGLLVVADGRVQRCGPASQLLAALPVGTPVIDHRGKLILPGFVDAHIHFPQIDVIASYGGQLLDWLERYTLPAEAKFADREYAAESARFFLDELLRNGTTSALVFSTVHAQATDALFEEAAKRNLRIISGKVLMDRNCPEPLRDTAHSGYRESAALIEKWHRHGRLRYAITPRFAGMSSEAQLGLAGKLAQERPDVHVHSHLAENQREVAWIRTLYPSARSYLDVYDSFGLVNERAVYAHCIHIDDADRQRMAQAGTAAAVCPTSNLFLGSGLFDFDAAQRASLRFGFGTDVGAGTTFSLLRTLHEGYKVAQLRGQQLSPWKALYHATLGGARALKLDSWIGNFQPGKEADFVVLRTDATPLMARRMALAHTPQEKIFALMMLGDERNVAATYVMGQQAYPRGGEGVRIEE